MEPKAHHVIIGLFTLVAVAAALGFALWLGKSSTDREWAYYQIEFNHAVSGLSIGNPVLYSGVQVGDVLDLKLDPEVPGHVQVFVRVDREVPIRENTRAGLILANITGAMNVQFSGGTPDSPVLNGNRSNPPLIIAEPSAFSSLLDNSEMLMQKADQLLTNAVRLMSEQNSENLTAILGNIRIATEALLERRGQLEALLERLDAAGTRAEEAAIKVSAVSDNANALLQDEGRDALTSLAEALRSVQGTADRIDALVRTNEGALDAGFQSMGELAPALRELRSTLRNLNQFTRRLEDDPAGVLFAPERIQELPR